jgi:NitT/TauT family transport system substrate-binding protein
MTAPKLENPMPRRALAISALALVLIAACGRNPGSSAAGACGSVPERSDQCSAIPAVELKVGLGYIPSVQFAPFYLAEQRGFYAGAGIKVTFENRIDPDLVTLVGQGSVDIGVADGTSVIPAVSQGIPIRYLATIYGSYPSIVFAKAGSGITTAADLAGRKIGIPGRYGSSWIMLQALLGSVGLTPEDVTIVEYPDFGQGVAVQQGAVDAATGFANNEPVQLELTGEKPVVLHVDRIVPLPGPGLIAGTTTIEAKTDAIRAFIAQSLRAMDVIAADPKAGLDAAVAAVPELGSDRDTQRAILDATIATWHDPTGAKPFGAIDRAGWDTSISYLTSLDMVPNPVTVDGVVRDDLLPTG